MLRIETVRRVSCPRFRAQLVAAELRKVDGELARIEAELRGLGQSAQHVARYAV